MAEEVKAGMDAVRKAAEKNAQNRNRQTGTLPNMGNRNRQTGTLPNMGNRNRQTGTLPNAENKSRQTGTLPNEGGSNRQTSTLPNGVRRQMPEDSLRPKRNVIGDEHVYTIPRGTVLSGNKARLVVDKGIWNSQYVEMYLVRGAKSSYVAKVYYEWAPENKYQDEIIKFLENNKQPGIIPLLDRGLYEGRDYYIFPYYEKKSLDEYKPEFNSTRLLKFVKVLNEALHSIHSAGFLHADIKPANILYDEKRDIPVITDFGSMTMLKQDAQMKVQRSITNADGKVSEGYLAPYALAYGAAKGESVLDLGVKTDYFALGVSLCEMYVRKPYYKMFRSNAEIAGSLSAGSVPYHREVEENKRLYNLVQALLSNSPDLCPGYKEVNDWLNGNTLKVIHRIDNRAGFSHYFRQKIYTDPKELAEAYVGENWKDCINDLFRKETLYDAYKKYDEGIYSEIIDIREDNQSEETKAASAFQIVCHMYPEIRFFWDGKYYSQESQAEADRELAVDIYKSVEAGDHKFDTLFSTGALRTYFELNEERKQFLKELDRILEVSEYAMERAQLIFAETISPGILTGMLTWDKVHNFDDYLKSVNRIAQLGGFDRAVEYNLGNVSDKNVLVNLQEKAYGSEIINALLCCNGHEEEIIQQEEKKDKVFQPLVRLLLIMGKILGYENVLSVIHKSASYHALNKYVQVSDQFAYIDKDPKRRYEAEPIKEAFTIHKELFRRIDKNPAAELRVYLDLFDDVLDTIGKIGDDTDSRPPVIYEKKLRDSGLLIARMSYILPQHMDGAMCIVNEKYRLPKAVARYLVEKGFDIKIRELEERKGLISDSLKTTKQKVDSFFDDFKVSTGTEDVSGEYLQKQWQYIFYILLPMITALFCGKLLQCGYRFWQDHAHDLKSAEGKYVLAVALVCVLTAFPGLVKSLLRFVKAVKNDKKYLDNKNLMDHYMCLKKTQEELEKFVNTGEVGVLSQKAKQKIQDIDKLGLNEYKSKYAIKEGYANIKLSPVRPSITKILWCAVLIAFLLLPVSELTVSLIKNDIPTAYQSAGTLVKNAAAKKVNQLYSKGVLKLMEKKNTDWLVDHFNREELTQEEYHRQSEQYINAFELNNTKISKKNRDILQNLILSKQSYDKGNYFYKNEKMEKAAMQYFHVTESDNNYEDAQKTPVFPVP